MVAISDNSTVVRHCGRSSSTLLMHIAILMVSHTLSSRLLRGHSFGAPGSDLNVCDTVLLVNALHNSCDDLVGSNLVAALKALLQHRHHALLPLHG